MKPSSLKTLIFLRSDESHDSLFETFVLENWKFEKKEIKNQSTVSAPQTPYKLILFILDRLENITLERESFQRTNIPIIVLSKNHHVNFQQLLENLPTLNDLIYLPLDVNLFKFRLKKWFRDQELKKRIKILTRHYSQQTDELLSVLSQDKKNREELKLLDKMKSEFTSTISHELRTPITAMKGAVATLQNLSLGSLNNEQKEVVQIIGRNADRLKTIVSDFLDFSQLNAGKTTLHFSLLPVSTPILESLETFKAILKKEEITLTKDISDNLPFVKLDHLKIIQVMNNLLNNAIKFTPKQGNIYIKVSQPQNVSAKNPPIEVSVSDTGIGIPESQLSRIFEKFSQVDSTSTRTYGGTGLGLSICKSIVEAHHGSIWAQSEEGKGSTFTFLLPSHTEA